MSDENDPTTHPGCEGQRGRDGVHRTQFCIFCLRKIGDDALLRVATLEGELKRTADLELELSKFRTRSAVLDDALDEIEGKLMRSGLRSDRGIRLLFSSYFGPKPVLTVECHTKWYALYVVTVRDPLMIIDTKRVELHHLRDVHERPYVDHVPNPAAVIAYADKHGYHVDEVALECIIGRWVDEMGLGDDIGLPTAKKVHTYKRGDKVLYRGCQGVIDDVVPAHPARVHIVFQDGSTVSTPADAKVLSPVSQ